MNREEAIRVLKRELEPTDGKWYPFEEVKEALNIAIEALQAAEPKTGEWTEIENGEYLCSNCSRITIGYPPSNCPNCGSFNGGEEE